MKRGNVFILIFVLIVLLNISILASFSYALINETKQIDSAYKWLEDSTKNKWQAITNIFEHETALLALSYDSNLKNQGLNSLKQKGFPSNNPYCWGEIAVTSAGQCKVKETATASFIYNQFGLNNDKINEWLLNQSLLFENIYWYLQLDIDRGLNASCNASYISGGSAVTQTITLNANKTVNVGGGACLNSYQNYWISIEKNCYSSDFKIACEINDTTKAYRVNFLYKESENDQRWFVADKSYSVESGQSVDVSIADVSKCLGVGTCDYESNAIAAYVLKQQNNEEYKNLLPYLKIMAETNKNVSYAWLYLITQDSSYAQKILSVKNLQGYWLMSSFGQSYDTAVNGYSLIKNANSEYNSSQTKNYLLNVQKQQGYWQCAEQGCRLLRDTAMLLYVFWPKVAEISLGGEIAANACEETGGVCESECVAGSIENPLLSGACGTGAKCCLATSSLSCYDALINGKICTGEERCIGQTIQTAEGDCCYNGTCQSATQTCADQSGYICDNAKGEYCSFGYEIAATDTISGQQCCSIACQSCADIGGNKCTSEEVCQGQEIDGCCVGSCISNKECSKLGGEVCDESGWTCTGTFIETVDTTKCCTAGDCIKDCSSEGGVICLEGQTCEGDEIKASNVGTGESCCSGTCKEKGKGWLIFLIILLVIIIGGVLFYLFKTGKIKLPKRGEKGKPPAAAGATGMPAIPPARPGPTPFAPPTTMRPMPPMLPRPIPRMMPKEEAIKKEEGAMPAKAKEKTKTEEQLAKTLEKVRKLTKR